MPTLTRSQQPHVADIFGNLSPCVCVSVCICGMCHVCVRLCVCICMHVCVCECAAVVNIWEFVLSYRSAAHFLSLFCDELCPTHFGLMRIVHQFVCRFFRESKDWGTYSTHREHLKRSTCEDTNTQEIHVESVCSIHSRDSRDFLNFTG